MRIAFVSNEFPPQYGGGIGTYIAAVAPILAADGHRVTIITVTEARHPQRETVDDLEIIRLPLTRTSGPDPMATLRAWQGRADTVSALLARMTRAEHVDVIEFPDYRGEGVTYLSSTTPGRRPVCVVKLHTSLRVLYKYNSGHVRFPVLESFEEQALTLADRVVSPSAALVDELRTALPDLGPVDVLPNPADPAFLDLPVGRVAEKPRVVYVGRLEQRKGVESLIQAAPRFLDACPDASLHLIGGDTVLGPDQPSMRALLDQALPSRYHHRVIYHGRMPRESLIEHYLSARVCVFPSLFENFPNTCLEAMSLARPVIGTDNSGMAEMIVDGRSGAIARAGDPDHLADTLIRVYQLPADQREEMGIAARRRIRDCFHPDRVLDQLKTLYTRYVEENPWKGPDASRRSVVSAGDKTGPASRTPKVAVVIPCFNHGRFLRETLASVAAQDHPNVETVVVDDGSSDPQTLKTLDALRAEGVRVIRQENQGLSAARNTGVRATDAPFFVPLDADDKIAPAFISRLLAPLLADETLGYCYGQVRFFGEAAGGWECPDYDPARLLVENLSVATAVIRRAAFDLVGGYQTDMVHGFEDWDFWLALLSVGYTGRCVREPLFFYRKHPPGQSMLEKTQQNRAEMVHRMVEHHRDLFASMLEVSVTRKDSMFFRSHMEAAQLRETLAHSASSPARDESPRTQSTHTRANPADDPLFQALQAQAELDYIENSRAWQRIMRFKQNPIYRLWANLRHGKGWDRVEYADPCEKLAAIKRSRFYRLLMALKRTPIYMIYARRKYGPDFVPPGT